jgi:hypothetical protein
LIATSGAFIVNSENEPFSSVSRKQRSLSSIVIVLCSIASAQMRGHSSTIIDSSIGLISYRF